MSLLDSQTARDIYHGIDAGDVAHVRRLLTDHPQFRTIATFLRPSWLHDAAAKGHLPMMEMLLDLWLDINKVDQPAQTRPLITVRVVTAILPGARRLAELRSDRTSCGREASPARASPVN